MHGRHRTAGPFTRPGRTPLAIAVVAALATVTTLVWQSLADADGCSGETGVHLHVAADPAIAPALVEVAREWTEGSEVKVNGRCVRVDVVATASADVASAIGRQLGGVIDVAASPEPTPEDPQVPAVWVPDSSYWLSRVQSLSRTFVDSDHPSLATSPVVLGVTPAAAPVFAQRPVTMEALRLPLLSALQNPAEGLKFGLAEPRRDTAGLAGAGWLLAAVVTSDAELPNVVGVYRAFPDLPPDPVSLLSATGAGLLDVAVSAEQAVISHNAATPSTALEVVPVHDAPTLDFPYATVTGKPRDVSAAAARFRQAITSGQYAPIFARHGFRAPDGSAPQGFPTGRGVTADPVPVLPLGSPEQVTRVLRIWTSARSHARVLSVVDVSASMQQIMTSRSGLVARRVDVMRATARQGLPLFTEGTDLGQWRYAARLDGEQDWIEDIPVERLTPEHRATVETAVDLIDTAQTDESAVFEVLIAAYKAMKEGYDPRRSNTIILWADGSSNKTGGLTLAEARVELERVADIARPIRVVILGLGPDADMEQLNALAKITGGGAFQVEDPDDVTLIFLKALLT